MSRQRTDEQLTLTFDVSVDPDAAFGILSDERRLREWFVGEDGDPLELAIGPESVRGQLFSFEWCADPGGRTTRVQFLLTRTPGGTRIELSEGPFDRGAEGDVVKDHIEGWRAFSASYFSPATMGKE